MTGAGRGSLGNLRTGLVWPALKEGVRWEGRGFGHKRATRGILVVAEMSVFRSTLLRTHGIAGAGGIACALTSFLARAGV